MKEQMTELVGILRHSESRRRELEKQSKQKEQTTPMATTPPVRFPLILKHLLLHVPNISSFRFYLYDSPTFLDLTVNMERIFNIDNDKLILLEPS